MLSRCTNPQSKSFKDYGGRGITVCERWSEFLNFYADMGQRPSPKHSIDRIDNERGYEPGNCRWETRQVQNLNRRLRTHCGRGHEFTDENTRIYRGERYCRTCGRERMREIRSQRSKAEVAA